MKALIAAVMMTTFALTATAHAQDTEDDVGSYDSDSSTLSTKTRYSRSFEHASVTFVPTIGLGTTLMSYEGDHSSNVTSVPYLGLQLGALAEMGSGRVSFQSGLMYLRETGRFISTASDTSSDSHIDITVDHVGIPLLAKINSTGTQSRVAFRFGVMPAFAAGATFQGETTSSSGRTYSYKESNVDGLRRVNVFALVGAGLELPLRDGKDMRFELTYDRTLLPLALQSDVTRLYAQSLLVTAAFGLGLF